MTKTTLDISGMIFDAAVNALQVHEDALVKRLSGNKARVELSTPELKKLRRFGETCLDFKTDDHRVKANMKRAAVSMNAMLSDMGVPLPTKAPGKPKKEKPVPIAPEDRPDPVTTVDPTKVTYDTLTKAFEFFNDALFHGKLPPVMLVIHRKRNAAGYFWNGVWSSVADAETKLSEIALNPELMGRDTKEVLSTLVHEMVHHEQQVFGKPSKSGHNVEWCEWMERVDLTPVGVGNCKGKRSGRNFTHEIVEGGAFDKAATEFLARDDVDMSWFSPRPGKGRKKQDYTKVKHTCGCGCNVWGKHNPDAEDGNLDITCNFCDTVFEPVFYA